jgi:hypothetical protein
MGIPAEARTGVVVVGRWSLVVGLLLLMPLPVYAQDTHLLVITGVGGDEEHNGQFSKWAIAIVDAAKKLGLPDANVTYLSGQPDPDPRTRGRSTKDNVSKALTDTAVRSKPNDDVFVLLIGHGSFDGRVAAFNLPGPDLTVEDYAKLLAKFALQHVVFVNTASSSGPFVQALAGPSRVIVTATKTGGERNETRFPEFFVEALQSDAADRDRNGRVSLLEAFDYARAKVQSSYEQGGHIMTEHAVLDDGSEGKFAATLFLAPRPSRSAAAATADPALRALLEQRDDLEEKVTRLRLEKEKMDPAKYEQELEALVTELAVKTRAIRDLEAKNK